MINYNSRRNRFILRCDVPENTDTVEYSVSLHGSPEIIYSGKCRYLGNDIEIDYSQFMESEINKRTKGIFPTLVTLKFEFRFKDIYDSYIDVDGGTSHSEFVTSPFNTIDAPVPVPQIGAYSMVFGTSPQVKSPIGVYSVYPVFYLKTGNGICVFDPVLWDKETTAPESYELSLSSNGGAFISQDDRNYFLENTIKEHRPFDMDANCRVLCRYPRIYQKSGSSVIDFNDVIDYLTGKGIELNNDLISQLSLIRPLAGMEITDENEALYNRYYGFTFRCSQEDISIWYSKYVQPWMTLLHVAVNAGYVPPITYNSDFLNQNSNIMVAFKCIHFNPTYSYVDVEYRNRYDFVYDECLYNEVRLALVNPYITSVVSYDDGLYKNSSDIIIPLYVRNGKLAGKTINNIDKVTYMDRYNDVHNSITTNKYEVECYIDPEWLKVTTGNDINYTKVMLAVQSSLKSYLVFGKMLSIYSGSGDGIYPISGIEDNDNYSPLECRVKDVEKIETHSNYSSSKPVPVLKLTIEIYK